MAESLVKNATDNRLVRGCYGNADAGKNVPTSVDGNTEDVQVCSYNVDQTPNDSDSVESDNQTAMWWYNGFAGRQGSQDNKRADYFVTDCTRTDEDGQGSGLQLDADCKLDGLTLDGYTATVNCSANFKKAGMESIFDQKSPWSRVSLSGKIMGIGKFSPENDDQRTYMSSDVEKLKIARLPLWKPQANASNKDSYDCSNRKVGKAPVGDAPAEKYPGRCALTITGHGGSGSGAEETRTGTLRDRCNDTNFRLQHRCGVTGLMMTTAFRDPRLMEDVNEDPVNLSNTAGDSIGWADVKNENQKRCCLGAGTYIQSRRPMGETCTQHSDCAETTVDKEGNLEKTNIRCFSDEDPMRYAMGEKGTCRRDGPSESCFDRVVFRSKYNPSNYGYFLATDQNKCNYGLPAKRSAVQKAESSDPKRLEIKNNTSPSPLTCDPNWTPYYGKNQVDMKSWSKSCGPHFEQFCQEVVLDVFVVDMPNQSWLKHKDFAASKGGRLATREEVLANKKGFRQKGHGEQWIAVEESNGTKDWVHVGTHKDFDFAASHDAKVGVYPTWGDDTSVKPYRAFVAYVVPGPRWQTETHLGPGCRAWARGIQRSGKKGTEKVVDTKGFKNLLLQHMCKSAMQEGTMVNDMLKFCNQRVKHDDETCIPLPGGEIPDHCPRWKTTKWGRGFCKELSETFPVEYDRLVWEYCTTPWDGKAETSGHAYDPACDCLSGEAVDPWSTKASDSDALNCGDPDATVKVIQNSDRYTQRQFRCATMQGDTVKQVGAQNRNLWMDTCNVAFRDMSLEHILLPQHKWQKTDNTASCDIDPKRLNANGDSFYQNDQTCHIDEYPCTKQPPVPDICMNIIDLRSQACVAVGGGVCTSLENVTMQNQCDDDQGGGDGNVANAQAACLAKNCPEGSDSPCFFRYGSTPLLTDTMTSKGAYLSKTVKCNAEKPCPAASDDCKAPDCTIKCIGGGGQNCIGNTCTTEDGRCMKMSQGCLTESDNNNKNLSMAKSDNTTCGCDDGFGWDSEKMKCVKGEETTPADALNCLNQQRVVQRSYDAACTCLPGRGFNPDAETCETDFKTSRDSAQVCRMSQYVKNRTYNQDCCNVMTEGWNPDTDNGALTTALAFAGQYTDRVCSPEVQTSEDTAMFCRNEKERKEKEEVRLSVERNNACCDTPGFGWNPSSQVMFDQEFPLRQCIRGVETSAASARKCTVAKEKIRKKEALRNERNQACCQHPDKGWNPSSLDAFDKEFKERKCLYQVETDELTARECRKIWQAKDYICVSPLFLVVLAAVVLAVGVKSRAIWIVLIVVGVFATAGWSLKTYTEKNFQVNLTDLDELKSIGSVVQ
jgi:hypothetical protein